MNQDGGELPIRYLPRRMRTRMPSRRFRPFISGAGRARASQLINTIVAHTGPSVERRLLIASPLEFG